jgi:hypothetical protein
MQLTDIERKEAIKSVLGAVYIFLAKFGSPKSDVEHLFEMYFGKPNREWGILGEALVWKVHKGPYSYGAEFFLRMVFTNVDKSKAVQVVTSILTKKEYEDGNAEARYYQTALGGSLPNSQKYIVKNLDEAIDLYIDVSRDYGRY